MGASQTNSTIDDCSNLNSGEPLSELDDFDAPMWQAVKELRNAPVVSVDFMLDKFLPKVSIDVEATKDAMRRVQTLSDSGWKDFKDTSMTRVDETEQSIFAPMKRIQNSIISCAVFLNGIRRSPTLRMETYPTFEAKSRTGSRTGPDACGQFVTEHRHYHPNANGRMSWLNTAYVEEYKTESSEMNLKKNVQKLLWSLERLMNVDHRRRFAFGTTVESTNMRFWFCCRQRIFVTDPFDFTKEHDRYIRIIASLAYATPSQLGYDPTVELVEGDDGFNYRITVHGKDQTRTYQTTGMLSSHPTKICGRGTRIYEAYDITDTTKQPVVLKDSWVDASRALEGDTLATILEGASSEERALFLTVLQHGVVNIDGQDDQTRDLILHGYDISIEHHFKRPIIRFRPKAGTTAEQQKVLSSVAWERVPIPEDRTVYKARILEVHPQPDEKLRPSRQYGAQVHYRLVFKEKGVSLENQSLQCQAKLSDVVTAMRDCIQALGVMWKRRYVHRDISPGNIIMYSGRARLSDLEFAHQYGHEAKEFENTRTGTYRFMSFELLSRQYYMCSAFHVVPNPLHDMESIWWVGVWALCCHYSPNTALLDHNVMEHIDTLRLIGETIFPSVPDLSIDIGVRVDQVAADCFSMYPWEGFTAPLQSFYHVLERLRSELFTRLQVSESSFPVDISHFTDPTFHATFLDCFTSMNVIMEDEYLWPMDAIWDEQEALLESKVVPGFENKT